MRLSYNIMFWLCTYSAVDSSITSISGASFWSNFTGCLVSTLRIGLLSVEARCLIALNPMNVPP
uniref:Uncharacterized protein n=1 Tax=Babesia bovis TaxID=5865 RepID=S6BLI0_BABBO|nr:hypothetical protein [Babesia bovis]BAN66184.1 hypothetical protein [Babesia bovis]